MPRPEQPDFLEHLRHEVADGRHWLDRAVVIGFAVLLSMVQFELGPLSKLPHGRRFISC